MNTEVNREGHDESEAEAGSAAETAADTEADADADTNALDEGEQVDVRHLPYNMVPIPSASGNEGIAAEVLKTFLKVHDREAWIDEVGNIHAPADDTVLLAPYVDTVPDDVLVKAENGALWGRGSADATGPFCTMAVAVVETGILFIGVVSEETFPHDAWHLVEDRKEPDTIVNGRPPGWDGVTLGYRGFPFGTCISTSELDHSSRPEENAIQFAAAQQSRMVDFSDKNRDGVFDTVTAKLVTFDGGPTEDGLAVEAMVDMQSHVPPRLSIDDVCEVAESELTCGDVRWNKPVPPVMMSPRIDVARAFRVAIRNVGGVKPRLLCETRTSDMNIFAGTWDCPMATYGPGDSDLDYAPSEHLDLARFDGAIDVLVDVCERPADD